eukprot:3736217-Alexandrium_andersonii.AAC.1
MSASLVGSEMCIRDRVLWVTGSRAAWLIAQGALRTGVTAIVARSVGHWRPPVQPSRRILEAVRSG